MLCAFIKVVVLCGLCKVLEGSTLTHKTGLKFG